jgi:hypothetical protein
VSFATNDERTTRRVSSASGDTIFIDISARRPIKICLCFDRNGVVEIGLD